MLNKTKEYLALFLCLFLLSSASDQPPANKWVTATPEAVTVHQNRIGLRCQETFDDDIRFFAVSTGDAAFADNVLSVLNSAILARRPVQVLYDPEDLSGSQFGCLNRDCRRLQAVQLR